MMSNLKSKLITSISASELTNRRISKGAELKPGTKMAYTVLKTKLDNKTYYCCLSGGQLEDGKALLTEVGWAALEALTALPVGNNDQIVMQEVRIGVTPIDQKVKETLRKLPSGSKICFFGDLVGELDGYLVKVFNVSGVTEV